MDFVASRGICVSQKRIVYCSPDLTWRDVQHIVAETARIPSADRSWVINGAGKHVSHTFGFGVLDAGAMVAHALEWKLVSEQHVCRSQISEINMLV